MTYSKSPFTSKTIWGIIISVVLKILAVWLDAEFPSEFHGYTLMQAILGASTAGDALAIYGRIVANENIKL